MPRRRPLAACAAFAFVFLVAAPPLAAQPGKDAGKPPAGKAEGKGGGKPPGGMPVGVALAKLGPAIDEASAIGTLRADESVSVRPEIAGRIARLTFVEGQAVRQGAVLATLEAAEPRAVAESSAAQAKLDQQRLERAEDLLRKGFISQQALDEARASLARSRAKEAEDRARLARTEIVAPFSGVMGLRAVSEGAWVAAGTDIARLEKIDALKLDFRVPEIFLPRLRLRQAVRVAVDAFPDRDFRGEIYAVEPSIDEQTRTVLVRARIANPGLRLRPGMFARVGIVLGSRERAVWVPEQAIVPAGQDLFVFRVVEGRAERVRVQTGSRRPGEVEIMRGVAAGDVVVVEGTQRIGPGAPVTALPAGQGGPAPAGKPPAAPAAEAPKKG